MNFSLSLLAKSILVASLIAIVAATGSGPVNAARGGFNLCPAGWSPVTPPLNPVLLCLPDTISVELGPDAAPPPVGFCPDGWVQATPPLNPVLGCLPGNIVRPAAPQAPARLIGGTCPTGFRPATSPLSPILGCLPDNYYFDPEDGGIGVIPPNGFCQDGWLQVTPPLNPLLICLPGRLMHSPPSGPTRGR